MENGATFYLGNEPQSDVIPAVEPVALSPWEQTQNALGVLDRGFNEFVSNIKMLRNSDEGWELFKRMYRGDSFQDRGTIVGRGILSNWLCTKFDGNELEIRGLEKDSNIHISLIAPDNTAIDISVSKDEETGEYKLKPWIYNSYGIRDIAEEGVLALPLYGEELRIYSKRLAEYKEKVAKRQAASKGWGRIKIFGRKNEEALVEPQQPLNTLPHEPFVVMLNTVTEGLKKTIATLSPVEGTVWVCKTHTGVLK